MVDIDGVVKKLRSKVGELTEKLRLRRLDMGDQDNSNVSRYITATRWAVEQEIESMDKELIRLQMGINELMALKKDKKRYFDKYFVADDFEYLEFGIISKNSKLGKEIMEK
ncbi:hypothetical protein HYV64_04930 [Candidatus Shapirobacteria bacterium]|nr:hypothetical protein [Candidatus Shapirobacteria bacterium]